MKHHEREFFISLIRSGKIFIESKSINLTILPPTIDQSVQSCQVYNKSYEQSYIDGMMNEEEMNDWMIEQGLWTVEDDEKVEGFKKDIEKLKVEIYNARNNRQLRERIRLYIRAGEKQFLQHSSKKNQYYINTCEGVAAAEKATWIIKNTTYQDNKLYDFNDLSIIYVTDEWQSSFLADSTVRDLARNEPWRSFWAIRENAGTKLFQNREDQELTYNQKNLIIWSQMYDNIQESMDCPPKDIIEDDDMLDGWFIIQNKKREKEKAEAEFEKNANKKIKNSAEIFVVANDKNDIERINGMNSYHATMVKKEREKLIKARGSAEQGEFLDEKLKVQTMSNQQFKDHR